MPSEVKDLIKEVGLVVLLFVITLSCLIAFSIGPR